MRKFIVTLLIALIIVVAAFLVSPYFIGKTIQNHFKQQFDAYNKSQSALTITVSDYKRNWFNSTAKLTIALNPSIGKVFQGIDKKFTFDTIIKHGPLFKTADGMTFARGAMILDLKKTQAPVNISAISTWDNHINLQTSIPQYTWGTGNNTTHLKDLTASFMLGKGTWNITANAKNLSVTTAKEKMPITASFNNLFINQKFHDDGGVGVGAFNAGFEDMSAAPQNTPSKTLLNIKKVGVGFTSTLHGNKQKNNITYHLNIDAINGMNGLIKVAPINFSVSLNDLDKTALASINRAMRNAQKENINIATITPEQASPLINGFLSLVEKGFQIKLNKLYVGLSEPLASGPISAQAQVTLKSLDKQLQKILSDAMTPVAQDKPSNTVHAGRDAMLSSLTNTKAQAGSPSQLYYAHVGNALKQSMPMIMKNLIAAISASGQTSVPKDLVMKGIHDHYSKLLARHAAQGQPVTESAQELTDKAYKALIDTKMILLSGDGKTITTKFTFDNGKLLINGVAPALTALPEPETQTIETPKTKTHEMSTAQSHGAPKAASPEAPKAESHEATHQ